MADQSNRIGSSPRPAGNGLDLLRQALGVPQTPANPAAKTQVSKTQGSRKSDRAGSAWSGGRLVLGPRGSRILPADYPVELLDANAVRGTYLDILV